MKRSQGTAMTVSEEEKKEIGTGGIHVTALTDEGLRKLADRLGPEWEKLATYLGFDMAQIYGFKTNNPSHVANQIFQMLVNWRQRQGASPDQLGTLSRKLTEADRKDLAAIMPEILECVRSDVHREGKVNVANKQPDKYICHKHKDGVKLFYCKTCDELICHACTAVDHSRPDHDFIDTGKASREYRQSLEHDFAELEREVQYLELSLQDTVEAKKVVNVNTAEARKDVQDKAAEVIAKVKAEKERLLDEITTHEQEQNKRLDEHEKTTIDMVQRKKQSLGNAKEVTSDASDCNFLSRYTVISKDLKKMHSQHLAQHHHKLWYLRFKRSQTVDDIDLGKVDQEGDTWQLHHTFGEKGSGEGQFEVARGIAAAAEPNEIAVTDLMNKRVLICNNQGPTNNYIPINANDVVAVSNHWVCVTPSKLMVYHRDTSAKFSFGTLPESEDGMWLISVAAMPNGNIIVGDKAGKVLTELDPKNGDILHTMQVRIRPDYLAVLSNGWIVVSDEDEGLVEIVDVSKDAAVTVGSIQPTIAGKPVKYCRGVCSNSSGIYLAVSTWYNTTSHIHQYECTGQFVRCVARGLYNPQGITFTPNGQQLAVADWHSIKVFHKV
ncbi:uncharacterized protein LOC119735309 [Patiria miniata]|uniref:B box-type domain-containing protein n=1 Tax=Patiria miniata TaxID=46514 RepID=A0A914AN53_PATMI|nr:uncharacterized protein LOC119735309 [Patiria miniata]